MTVETKTTIELSDIMTVEFECKNCHAATSWPIGIAKIPPVSCACQSGVWMAQGGETYTAIADLIALVRRLGKADKEAFSMRFGVKGTSAQ